MQNHHPEALQVFDAMEPQAGGPRLPARAVPGLTARWAALPEAELRDALSSLVGLAAWLDEAKGQRAGADDLMRFGDRLARLRRAETLRESGPAMLRAADRFGVAPVHRAPKFAEAAPEGTFSIGSLNAQLPRPRAHKPAGFPRRDEDPTPRSPVRARHPMLRR